MQQLLLLPSDPAPSSSTAAVRSRTPFRSLEGGRAEAGAASSSLDDELGGGDDGSKAARWCVRACVCVFGLAEDYSARC